VLKPTQAAAAMPQHGAPVPSPIAQRSYVTGNFFLALDGSKAGFVKAIDGGFITADVIDQSLGASGCFTKKHIGSPTYEEFSLQVGFSVSKAFYDWIAASWQMNYTRHDGSVILADFEYIARSAGLRGRDPHRDRHSRVRCLGDGAWLPHGEFQA
jgi:hypothetical protein